LKSGSSTDWLSSGGAYWFLAGEVFVSAVFYACAALYLGKVARSQNDGCLLAIVNVLAALCGGGVGFWFAHYPLFVLTTLAGTLTLPLAVTVLAAWRFRKQLKP
jgi:hypothetical protein